MDNEVGGATATGWGEAVVRAVGCFLVVELMRQGHGPAEACELAVERVIEKNPDWQDIQVGFLALSKSGEVGSFCIIGAGAVVSPGMVIPDRSLVFGVPAKVAGEVKPQQLARLERGNASYLDMFEQYRKDGI